MPKFTYSEFFDINSSSDGTKRFTIVAGGEIVKRRLAPFFGAYKYYKLGAVRVKCVPASTLPVDPTGLSLEAGETTVDPRDLFNPGLCRITNGETIDAPTSGVVMTDEEYIATMLDPRWFKFRLQSGFQRSATPLVWNIAQAHQDAMPGQTYYFDFPSGGAMLHNSYPTADTGLLSVDYKDGTGTSQQKAIYEYYSKLSLLQNSRVKLGWMPTDDAYYSPTKGIVRGSATVPEIDLISFILPKAHKTKFYYRLFVSTTVYFKDPVVIDPVYDTVNGVLPPDRFIYSILKNDDGSGTDLSETAPIKTQGGKPL